MRDMIADVEVSPVGRLLADPARARMASDRHDGPKLSAGELVRRAGISASTVSEHVARLVEGGLLAVTCSGRHRYYRLASDEVARAFEGLVRACRSSAVVVGVVEPGQSPASMSAVEWMRTLRVKSEGAGPGPKLRGKAKAGGAAAGCTGTGQRRQPMTRGQLVTRPSRHPYPRGCPAPNRAPSAGVGAGTLSGAFRKAVPLR